MKQQKGTVSDKVFLTPKQLRVAAEKRLGDATCLHAADHVDRANGTLYLVGLAVECAPKASLLERKGWTKPSAVHAQVQNFSDVDQAHWRLIVKKHDLEALLELLLPALQARVDLVDRKGENLWRRFRSLCQRWRIYVRYSPYSATRAEADEFLAVVRKVRPCLV